jgi:hypothetical protein
MQSLRLMHPPHLIVELHAHAAKGLAQRLTSSSSSSSNSNTIVTADGDSSSSVAAEGWSWSAVDYFLPEDLDSGVLVQVVLLLLLQASTVYRDICSVLNLDMSACCCSSCYTVCRVSFRR